MVSDLKTFSHKGYKIAAQKKGFFSQRILPYHQDFFCIGATMASVKRFFVSRMRDFFYHQINWVLYSEGRNLVVELLLIHQLQCIKYTKMFNPTQPG